MVSKDTILIFPWAKKIRSEKKLRNPKDYPFWPELIHLLKKESFYIIQISLSGEDEIGADELILDKPFKEICEMIKICYTVLTVDSMANHLAWYLKKRAVVLFSQSDPKIFGHFENLNLLKDRKYLRPDPFNVWEAISCNDEAFYKPGEVIDKMKKMKLIWS